GYADREAVWGCDVESWGVDPEGVGGVPNSVVRGIGLAGLFIPMTTTVVALTLLPVVLSKLGPKMDWPRGNSTGRPSREIAVHMHRLRRKVDPASGMPVILTLRGEGYLIRNDTP
ncbi:MAG: helix-turn-helix domain-containing protein, partial [Actinomycetota bacterium]|nr:helix-turn-helix domain-containing protein [Actinomycetota bacterium]